MHIPTSAARWAASSLLVVALAACQEPTGVGLGLIDDETSQPNVRPIPATSVQLRTTAATTAGFAASGTPAQTRVLIGTVGDPLFGDATARAYLDASLPAAGRPQNFQDSTITAVALELRFDDYVSVEGDTALYVYGDPSAHLPIEIREIDVSWAPTDLAVDATLETGDIIATGSIAPTDTTYTIDLAPSWVAANADKIRSEDFVTAFEGLEVRVPEGTLAGAVRGFDVTRSDLLIATASDTLRFPVNEVLTSIVHGNTPPVANVLALRAGMDQAFALDFDFAAVGNSALARADVRLPVERSLTGGSVFVRPLARRALLVGIDSADEQVQLTEIIVPTEGNARTIGGPAFTSAIQDVLIGSRVYQRYEVSLPSNPVSLDLLPVVTTVLDRPNEGPRFTLTLVGQPS